MELHKQPMIVHCGDCHHEWAAAFLPIPMDVLAKLGKSPCPMCGGANVLMGPSPKATAAGDPVSWLLNGDTGISSETIWSVMMGRDIERPHWHADIPHDPDDFGRCYRLLKVMPNWRNRLNEVAEKYPIWRPIVEVWDELTAFYEEELPSGRAPKLYDRLQRLQSRTP